jgi:hypothetical protein
MDQYIGAAYDSPLLLRALIIPVFLVASFTAMGFGLALLGMKQRPSNLDAGLRQIAMVFILPGVGAACGLLWTGLICGFSVVIMWGIIVGSGYLILLRLKNNR